MKTDCLRSTAGLSLVAGVLLLSGCATVGPDYVRPETAVPATWHIQIQNGLSSEKSDPKTMAEWWARFDDAELSSLMERAIAGNLDLKKASARIHEARARRGIARAGLSPTLNGSGSTNWSRADSSAEATRTNTLYSVDFDAGWELDIFGGTRRTVESSEAELQATWEDLHDLLVSLQAEVALNYIDVRTYQARLLTAEKNLEQQNESYKLAEWRYQAGLSDGLAVQQALYNLENTRSQIPALRAGLEETLNRIAVLLGEQPGEIHKELETRKPIPAVPLEIAIGIPADIVRQRPDIRRAERELAAQTAKVGVAMADLYPKFNLSGLLGISAETLFGSGSRTSSAGSRISLPLFNAGSVRQGVKIREAVKEQYLIQYKTTVLNALEEVENALTAFSEEQRTRANLQACAQAAQKAVDLALNKYQSGLIGFNDVLDAQRSLLSFQEKLVQSDGAAASCTIRLYKTLGGGWTSLSSDAGK